jgi:predicted glutamine amidotransferase
VQGTFGISNGERLWGVRYSSEHASRTLYLSADRQTVQALHPDNPRFQRITDEDRMIVSEPLSDLPGVWIAVPESTALVVQPGADEQQPFPPRMPVVAVAAGA